MEARVVAKQRVKRFSTGVFLTYIVVVLYATLFTYNYYVYGKSVNLIAFDSIKLMFNSGNWWLIFKNVVGNILLFLPLGYLLPLVIRKMRKLRFVFIISFFSSFAIETAQFYFAERIFDVDDILLNTLGACVGYLLFAVSHLIYKVIKGNIKGVS